MQPKPSLIHSWFHGYGWEFHKRKVSMSYQLTKWTSSNKVSESYRFESLLCNVCSKRHYIQATTKDNWYPNLLSTLEIVFVSKEGSVVSQYSQINSQIDCLIISVICSYLDTTLRNKICFNVNASADIPTSQLLTTAWVRITTVRSSTTGNGLSFVFVFIIIS